MANGVTADSINDVEEMRQKVLESFERHVRFISPHKDTALRFANLLLLLPSIGTVARDLVEDVHLAKLFGLASIDRTMASLILNESQSEEIPQSLLI
uniref:NR LBD domain-containing protein n=2 Tax=Caenorhabditis japonica TaxID=281687 RepID=A0A8R1ECQ8_CAEJA